MLSNIPFFSFLSYIPRGSSERANASRDVVYKIKSDRSLSSGERMIDYTVRRLLEENPEELRCVFGNSTVVVPVPKSTLMKKDTLWVPERICESLVSNRLARETMTCLRRITPVPKSAGASQRPSPEDHFSSMRVDIPLIPPKRLTLVDDVVTRGSTLLSAYTLVQEAFPFAEIHAFAVVRTISDESNFKEILDPCRGTIVYHGGNSLTRSP